MKTSASIDLPLYFRQILPLPGGLAIRAGDEVVGAIGVGGAPGGDKDERCALAGIEAIQSRLKSRAGPG
jgi:uncharacterized protein GlcG (DUF336 family)